jgi:hypothetical protein
MVVSWLLFPLLLLAVCLGSGLLVQWLAGWQLPGATLISVGLAAQIALVSLVTRSGAIAHYATAAAVVIAVAGFALGWRALRTMALDGWLVAAGVAVFLVCAAPMVLSGQTTFLGYFVLNDGGFHLPLMNWIISHGHALPTALPASSYTATLDSYLTTSYPVGADMAIAALRPLVGQDVAWLFQPFQAVVMAFGATVVYELWRTTIGSRPLRALAAFAAAQAGLLYAYYAEASIKEVSTAWLITLTVVIVFATLRRGMSWRGWIVLAVIAVAGDQILGLTIAAWIGIPLLAFVVVTAWRGREVASRYPRRRAVPVAGAIVLVLAGVIAIVVDRELPQIRVVRAVLTGSNQVGNLGHPLPRLEMVGIWPSVGDFRTPVVTGGIGHVLAYVLIWLAVASGIGGIVWALARRHWEPLLLIASSGIAAAYLLSQGDPYADGKVMMIFSIASIATAMLGPAALLDLVASRDRQPRRAWWAMPAWGLAAVITAGVLWTTVETYRSAAPAPRARLNELAAIDHGFVGRGPTFVAPSNEYVGYFLRDMAPVDSALSPVVLRSGLPAVPHQPIDPDDLPLATVESYRLLVLDSGPLTSRPPSNFRLAYRGRFYDVWRRTSGPAVLSHSPLGGAIQPGSVPGCRAVERLARRALARHAHLAYVRRPASPAFVPARAKLSPAWLKIDNRTVDATGPGEASGQIRLARTGNYRITVEGDVSRELRLQVDGHPAGSISGQLGPPGQTTSVAIRRLSAGRHEVRIYRAGSRLAPGANTPSLLGPVVFQQLGYQLRVDSIAPARARRLCGRRLDWIEVIRGR